jgi:NAD(P)-dependent dehydrogenase (short-subunit alcohol dehydrogenase family)
MAISERHRFDGQGVLITGASSGIGASLAREFAREGAHTVLVARRVERIEALAAELTTGSQRSVAVAGDVTRDGDLERAVDLARREFGRLDVAVANAGILAGGRIIDLTLDDYRKQLETNTFGALRTVMAALPALQETRGRIVLMGSLLGMVSVPGDTPYCVSKFALNGLSDGLCHELAPFGISVTQVMAGVREDRDLQQATSAAAAEMDRLDRAHSGSKPPGGSCRPPTAASAASLCRGPRRWRFCCSDTSLGWSIARPAARCRNQRLSVTAPTLDRQGNCPKADGKTHRSRWHELDFSVLPTNDLPY